MDNDPKFYEDWDALLQKHGIAKPRCSSGVGRGWWPILEILFTKLKELGFNGTVDQIKEKFGGLRFYTSGMDDYKTGPMSQAVRDAEATCWITCEQCGQPGTKRGGGWIHVACDTCEAKNLAARQAEEAERQRIRAAQVCSKCGETGHYAWEDHGT